MERIARTIVKLRGQNVMRDADLAALYKVTTKRLNEQVKRNRQRFPPDFMFQVTEAEYADLRSQSATSSPPAHGGPTDRSRSHDDRRMRTACCGG